ncbi:AAA family ATPase [Demequina zhanjiangensis]|uniref:AAA family ATPase n=1 Tax=Demequina zhanjiangensis TaxID=3051659 RepID=A0ABT8G019_9MICO|nr:AAA family ATPase [Demequina sp. SYSU T00b26]MDN4472491.1 AAA family ATPase [Demequina sp. SYSU T00b26]
MLTFADPLPRRPQRVLIAGVSGTGKTTLAGRLSPIVGLPHTEIDALFHGPEWTRRDEFMDDVRALASADAWITEWQYREARPLLAERADLLIWLDLPFLTVTLPRVIRRTVRRRLRREELWSGNIERPFPTILTDREHIVRWAWSRRGYYRTLIPTLPPEHPDLAIVRLRSQREVERWVAGPLVASVRADDS